MSLIQQTYECIHLTSSTTQETPFSNLPLSPYLVLLDFALLCFADIEVFTFFFKLTCLLQLCTEHLISAICPTAFAHFVFLSHISVILGLF